MSNDLDQRFSQLRPIQQQQEQQFQYAPPPDLNRLSRGERWLFDKLPGFSESRVSKVMQWFSESWRGKLLNVFDIGAEGLERGLGLYAQWNDARKDPDTLEEFKSNLGAAWRAGSLYYDVSNIPKITDDGLQWVTSGLPGMSAVVYARRQIAKGRDLEEVRGEVYDSLGVMALRAQLNDAIGHVALDPINIVMPFVKPVERTRDFITTLGNMALPEHVLNATQEFSRMQDVVNSVDDIADIARVADNVDEMARLGTNADEMAKLGRIVEEFGETATKEDVLTRLGGLLDQYAEYQKMSPAQQKILQFTGNLPGLETKFDDLPKWKQVMLRFNPFALTPQSRADGILNTIASNLGILQSHADDPVEFARVIRRVADGTMGPEFGHMVVRPEGRLVQSALQAIAAKADDAANAWITANEFERPMINLMEQVLGDTAGNIVKRFRNGEAASLYQSFTRAVAGNQDAAAELQRILAVGGHEVLDPQNFGSVLKMFDETPALLHENGMKLTLYVDALEHMAQQSIVTFGVKQQGALREWADALKKVETIAFLRTNPTYPIRNLINNTTTMLARGIFNSDAISKAFTRGQLDEFWSDLVGFVPPRAAEGIGMHAVDDIGAVATDSVAAESLALSEGLASGRQILRKQVTGDSPGLFARTASWLEENTVGRLKGDMGTLAQKAERWASERGYASGFLRWMSDNWKANGKYGFTHIDSFSPGLAGRIGAVRGVDDFGEVVSNVISGTLNSNKLDDLAGIDNLRMDIGNIVAEAEKIFPDLRQVVPDGMIEDFGKGLSEAVKKGEPETLAYINRFRSDLENAVLDQMDEAVRLIADETAMVAKAEGPGAYTKLWSEAVDDTLATQEAHAMETARIMEEIRNGTDPAIRSARYEMYRSRQTGFWNRHWQRQEARMGALAKTAKEIGMEGADDVIRNFTDIKKGWQGFFRKRDKLWGDFHEALKLGKQPKLQAEEIIRLLDSEYQKIVEVQSNATRAIDDLFSEFLPNEMREGYMQWRGLIADARRADMDAVTEFRRAAREIPAKDLNDAWKTHWQERMTRWRDIHEKETQYLGWLETAKRQPTVKPVNEIRKQQDLAIGARDMMESALFENMKRTNPERASKLEEAASAYIDFKALSEEEQISHIMDIARRYVGESKSEADVLAILAEEVKMARPELIGDGGYMEYLSSRSADALALTEEYFITRKLRIMESSPPVTLNSASQVVGGTEMNMGAGMDELLTQRTNFAVDALEESVMRAMGDPAVRMADLDPADAAEFGRYISHVKGQMNDARYAALRTGEFVRDSALLNYSRRYNYNTWLGVLAPYEFWATQTAFRWALHSIDRPAMMSTYLRMSKMLRTGYRPETGFPSRLKGSIRLKLPFISDWLGEWIGEDVFINPLQVALPFEGFGRPFDEMQYQSMSDEGSAMRVLDELLNDGQITEEQYAQAAQSKEGAVWQRALSLVQMDDSERRSNAFDFMSMVTSPHAPIVNAYHRIMGEPEEIGPWMPATRTIKGVTSLLGINEGRGVNIEGAIREQLGLHPFDQWDDYRVERMMINMLADGSSINGMPITAEMVQRALIEHAGPLWVEAGRRAGKEWGFSVVMGSITGTPTYAYPTGEENVRRERELYEQAWEQYEAGDHTAINRFMEEYPEYEARLSLFKSPEERLNTFLVDQIWDTYNQLPDLDRREVREVLGDNFVNSFLNPNTRSTDSLPPELLATWLKMMGGDPPGTLGENAIPIAMAPPEISQTAQFFYDYRRQQYPDFYQQQQEYFSLDEGQARRDYKRENPDFAEYMDWRWDFLKRNPTVAPYLTDNPPTYETYQELMEAQQIEPNVTYDELEAVLIGVDYSLLTELQNYAYTGTPSPDLSVALGNISTRTGIPVEQYLRLIQERYASVYTGE